MPQYYTNSSYLFVQYFKGHWRQKGQRGQNISFTYTEATLKFLKLNTQAQQREAVVQG
ncbi:MAG: hypothetical protein LBJ00_10070 [Planctomycetaceae bacterium]|nr:hypothetical protein [Planctomycetaceae bacterium]